MPPAARSRLLATLLALAASGCLGGGGATSATGPTRAQFVTRATAICNSYQHRIGTLPRASDLTGLAVAGRRAVALERAELGALRRLTPAPADRAAVGRMLDALDRSITAAAQLTGDAAAGDRAGVAVDAQALSARLLDANRLAKPFRLGTCAP